MAGEAKRLNAILMAAAVASGHRAGEDLLGEAQRRAPVREGTLRASGEVDVDVGPGGVLVTVAFNEVYAARQHEELEWEHPKGGEAKYLEGPLRERAPRYERLAAAELERRLR